MADNIADTVDQQLADLKRQVADITEMLAERGLHLLDQAEDGVASVAKGTKVAVRHVQDEAANVVEAARENPIAASTAVATIAGLAFAAGYLLGLTHPDRRQGWRF